MILGVDEAGRGPWAGPLVVGAVVLGCEIGGLDDSKKLTKKRREALEPEILTRAQAAATGWVSAAELDELGMSEALRLATRRAVEQIRVPYHEIIIDGTVNFLVGTSKGEYVTTMPKADALVPSVSAASIIAKVARDRYMTELDTKHPGYGFASHAGYGVAKHRAAIDQLGVCPEHRLSFAPLQKYQLTPLPSSQISSKSARRSLLSGPVTRSAPNSPVSRIGAAPPRATRAGVEAGEVYPAAVTAGVVTRAIGDASETAAAEELVRRGHEILERNWKTKYCEIDIVSRKGDTVYFTEVKHRKNDAAGDGLAAITPKKLNQMEFAARLYAHTMQLSDVNLQLLAIATTGDPAEVAGLVVVD